MSEIETVRNSIVNKLTLRTSSETASQRFERIQKQMEKLPSVLDKDTLTKLKNGEYEISLKEYTDFSSYKAKMNALYGNNSANVFQNYLNNTIGNSNDFTANAKDFIDKMQDNGMSNRQAVKLYSALKSYSLVSSFKNYNFISAKI